MTLHKLSGLKTVQDMKMKSGFSWRVVLKGVERNIEFSVVRIIRNRIGLLLCIVMLNTIFSKA